MRRFGNKCRSVGPNVAMACGVCDPLPLVFQPAEGLCNGDSIFQMSIIGIHNSTDPSLSRTAKHELHDPSVLCSRSHRPPIFGTTRRKDLPGTRTETGVSRAGHGHPPETALIDLDKLLLGIRRLWTLLRSTRKSSRAQTTYHFSGQGSGLGCNGAKETLVMDKALSRKSNSPRSCDAAALSSSSIQSIETARRLGFLLTRSTKSSRPGHPKLRSII